VSPQLCWPGALCRVFAGRLQHHVTCSWLSWLSGISRVVRRGKYALSARGACVVPARAQHAHSFLSSLSLSNTASCLCPSTQPATYQAGSQHGCQPKEGPREGPHSSPTAAASTAVPAHSHSTNVTLPHSHNPAQHSTLIWTAFCPPCLRAEGPARRTCSRSGAQGRYVTLGQISGVLQASSAAGDKRPVATCRTLTLWRGHPRRGHVKHAPHWSPSWYLFFLRAVHFRFLCRQTGLSLSLVISAR
jgi:hypothetical protein